MKLHCHWAALPQRSTRDQRPLKAAIDQGLTYMVHLIRARCAAAHRRCVFSPKLCPYLIATFLFGQCVCAAMPSLPVDNVGQCFVWSRQCGGNGAFVSDLTGNLPTFTPLAYGVCSHIDCWCVIRNGIGRAVYGIVWKGTQGGVWAVGCRLGIKCRVRVSPCHIKWLGLRAFHTVLARKKSRYPALLGKLETELAEPQYRHLSRQLASVIDPEKSSVFDEIRF